MYIPLLCLRSDILKRFKIWMKAFIDVSGIWLYSKQLQLLLLAAFPASQIADYFSLLQCTKCILVTELTNRQNLNVSVLNVTQGRWWNIWSVLLEKLWTEYSGYFKKYALVYSNNTFSPPLEFHIIVCGLDSIIARRWINGMLVKYSIFLKRGYCLSIYY